MAGSSPNLHTMDSRSACIEGVLKVKVKVKGHVIRALSWILAMSYSVIDGLVLIMLIIKLHVCCNCNGNKYSVKGVYCCSQKQERYVPVSGSHTPTFIGSR